MKPLAHAIGVRSITHSQLAKTSFDVIPDFTADVFSNYFVNTTSQTRG